MNKLQSVNNVFSKCPKATVNLDGIEMTFLLDTGSEVSTIPETVYEKHFSSVKVRDTTQLLKLVAANDTDIPYLGYIELDLDVCGCKFHNVGFLVSKDINSKSTEGIFGCNILKYTTSEICDNDTNSSDMENWDKVKTVFEMNDKCDRIAFVKVAGKDNIRIPAYSMKVVTGSTRHNKKGEEYAATVQAIQGSTGALPRNISVIDTLSNVCNGKVFVRVVNMGSEDVWLKAKSRIGTLLSVDSVRSTSDNYDVEFTDKEVVVRKMTVDKCEQNVKSDIKLNINDVEFSEEQKKMFDALLKKHSDSFCKDDFDLGQTSLIKHSINLNDEVSFSFCTRS